MSNARAYLRGSSVAMALAMAISQPVAAQTTATPRLTAEAVVAAAFQHNATLAAATSELRRAQLLEQAEEHRYSLVLGMDSSVTRSQSPNLTLSGTTTPQATYYRAGADLSRHTVLGTDLKLRVEGWREKSQSTMFNTMTTPPSMLTYAVGPGYGATVKFSLTQPLLRGAGRDVYYAELDQARVNRASARSARDQTASQLLLDILTAYWELNYATRSVEIQSRALEVATAQRDEAALRVNTGSAAPVDVLSFETNVATIEEDLATAQAAEQTQATELLRLIGDPDLRLPNTADTSTAIPEPDAPSGDIKQQALRASYELAQQRAAVDLATVQSRTADQSFRPKLDVDAYVQAQGLGNRSLNPMVDQLSGLGAVSAYVGLTYQAALDGTQRTREQERALMAIQTAKQRVTALEQRLSADVDKALTSESSSQRRVKLADTTYGIAHRQYEAELQRFRTGSSTALQVREAENSARTAELRASRARTDWIEAALKLEHLSGNLLTHWGQSGNLP